MKDAYSFHVDEEDAQREYQQMYDAYQRIFTRCGLAFRAVEADTGTIGGSLSHEFQVLAETGEDALVACDSCDYAANVEQAESRARPRAGAGRRAEQMRRSRRRASTRIADVSAFLKVPPDAAGQDADLPGRRQAGGGAGARRPRRQRDQAEEGARRRPSSCWRPTPRCKEATGAPVGFAGPVGLEECRSRRHRGLRADRLRDRRERGGRAPDRRQRRARLHADRVRRLPRGRCRRRLPALRQGHLEAYRGIEVGQVFFLGTKYSKPMGVTFLDADGQGEADGDGLLRHRRHPHRRGGDRAEPRQGRHHLAGAARAVRGRGAGPAAGRPERRRDRDADLRRADARRASRCCTTTATSAPA